jgi:hypothetical protein
MFKTLLDGGPPCFGADYGERRVLGKTLSLSMAIIFEPSDAAKAGTKDKHRLGKPSGGAAL